MDLPKNKPCPACVENGHDSTGNHLFLHRDGKKYVCSHVNYHKNKQYYFEIVGEESKVETKEETIDSVLDSDVSERQTVEFRKIPASYWEKWGVSMDLDSKGEVSKVYYPLETLCGGKLEKIRKVEGKKFFMSEERNKRKLYFFGQSLAGQPKRLLITEGQDDAVASSWMLRKYDIKVVSVPDGASIGVFLDNFSWLEGIEDITIDFDEDEAGRKLESEVFDILPRVKVLRKKLKDSCDMRLEGLDSEYVDNYYRAKTYTPDCIVKVDDALIEEATIPVEWGLSLPFNMLTKKTFGLTHPQVIGIGAAPGAGKTTFTQAIQSHLIDVHKERIGIMDLETAPGFSLRKLIGYKLGLKIHTPDTPYPIEMQEKAREIGESLKDRVVYYKGRGNRDWDKVMGVIRWMVANDIRYIFIDPLSGLTAGLESSEANRYLNNALFTLSETATDLNFTAFHVNHLNPRKDKKDHGEGGRVGGGDFTGSRAQWRFSTDLWGLERDQQAEDEEERETTYVRIIKHRLDGNTGTFKLGYDRNTGRYTEGDFEDQVFNPPPEPKEINVVSKDGMTIESLL